MNFFKWSIYEPLKINKYGIPEPISDKKIDPNILLIPLVGFDDKLNRLGYGGGYYDRYLSRLKLGNSLLKIGVGFSFQKVKNLDYRLEYNMVRPYTYSHYNTGTNYVHFNQPLAHPLVANFKEIINRVQYIPMKNLFVTVTYTYSTQGLDSAGYHFGANILELYTNRPFDYGVVAGQGVTSNINTFNLELSYMVRHNFFIDFNFMLRNYKTDFEQLSRNDLIMNFGVRWNAVSKNLSF